MNTSTEIDKLAEALSLAQAEMTHAAKDANNPAFKSKYTTLAALYDAGRPVLTKHGLSVTQVVEGDETRVAVTTRLMHKSGQFIEGTFSCKPGQGNAQGMGSAATYGKRYGYSAIIGLCGDDDDDGNAASARDSAPSRPANDRGATTTAPRTQSPVVGHSGKPATDDAKAKQDAARKEIRDAVAWMNIAHEERELLAMLDNLDVDDLRREYKRIMEAKKLIQTTDLPL